VQISPSPRRDPGSRPTPDASAPPIVIVGAGLAGLACARHLVETGRPVLVLEAQDGIGGRVRTDQVNAFPLDRGFQVFLTAYPEAAALLDYDKLALRPFYPGALIQLRRRRYRFADPWRRPLASLSGLLAPVASLPDAVRIARLRAASLRRPDPNPAEPPITTEDYLRQFNLSPRVVDRFFRPFFGGVFLDRTLSTPSSFFRFVFAMFATGDAAIPAGGMQAIPQQLADTLPPGTIRLNTPVKTVEPQRVRLASGQTIHAAATVLATDAHTVHDLLPPSPSVSWNSTTTIYYAAPRAPIPERILVLNGTGHGFVNHVCIPALSPHNDAQAAPALISVSLLGIPHLDDDALNRRVLQELRGWFGIAVKNWELLRIYRIEHALPSMPAPGPSASGPVLQNGCFRCGDYLENPSINGALASGRKAAAAVNQALRPE